MLKILLADDEAEERNGITYLIQKYNYPLEIAEAVNGQKALEYIKEHSVDILFTDVKMPFKDGLTLAKEVYEYNPRIKTIIFSAYGEFEYAKKAMSANAVDYLLKPIELEEFQKVMEEVLQDIADRKKREELAEWAGEQKIKIHLYRALGRVQLKGEEQEELKQILFKKGVQSVLLVSLEAAGNLFEREEDKFLQLLAMYIKEDTEYVNLYPNESYLILSGHKKTEDTWLKEQLTKIIRDVEMVFGEMLSIVIGRNVCGMTEFLADISDIHDMRAELFGFPKQIFSLTDGINTEYYAKEVEDFKEQFINALNQGSYEHLPETAGQLVQALQKGNMVSRIYVEHLFYEILNMLYEKLPGEEREEVYQSLHILLECRSSSEMMERFAQVVSRLSKKLKEESGEEHGIAASIIRIIEREYQENLSLDYLAERVHLAPAYVSYMFKQETGETLVKYITDFRMEQAQRMLDERQLKIVQVGQSCGYENQSYFNRLFKNYFGMTPKQYRERTNDETNHEMVLR